MSTNRNFDRIAEAWLADGPTELADRVLDAALREVHRTHQRRWLPAPWRTPSMSLPIRAAAAVAIVLVVGFAAFQALAPGSGPGAGPTATPSPTPSSTPLALPQNSTCCSPLAAGTYLAQEPFPIRVTFTLPDGWQGNLGGTNAIFLERPPDADLGRLDFTFPASVFADACNASKGQLKPAPGPSVDDFVNALVAIPGLRTSAPTDVTFAGYRGKRTTLTPPATSTCTPSADGEYPVWQLPLGAVNGILPGDTQTVTVLDVAGHRLVIASVTPTAAVDAEVQTILGSMRIEPVPATPAPSASPAAS
jgi:hypothetical protein